MRQCNVYATKGQYDKSMECIADWLVRSCTIKNLGIDAVNVIKSFQATIMGKEDRLAFHFRKHIYMCADAMTTSPVESMNDLMKNKQKLYSNHNLSTCLQRISNDQSLRYDMHVQRSFMEMNKNMLSSRAPTKNDIHRRCQHMLDYFHDNSQKIKCCQVSDREWYCWNFMDPEKRTNFYNTFNVEDEEYDMSLEVDAEYLDCGDQKPAAVDEEFLSSLTVPSYLNVYHLIVSKIGDQMYMKCSCMYDHR